MLRLGVVSFLNSRPLIDGLAGAPGLELAFDVPAALPARLEQGTADAALVPVIDVLRRPGQLQVVSDACIACDGETMTVRVFSQQPPHCIRELWADIDSHTSVALARVLWRALFDCELVIHALDTRRGAGGQGAAVVPSDLPAVLLIGDKVVDPGRGSFGYEVDLGGAWRQHTGLPFVFAVWARRQVARLPDERPPDWSTLATRLSQARDRGVARAAEIADADGPRLGWPVELARRYLTRCLRFTLDARAIAGANLFAQRCAEAGLAPPEAAMPWPEDLVATLAGAAS